MLQELIMNLLSAGDKKEKDRAYRQLERVGVDRRTADVLAHEMMAGQGAKEVVENE